MAYNETWLRDYSTEKIILAVVTRYNVLTTSEEVIYLSNKAFISSNADVVFLPHLSSKDMQFNESISINGGISTSYGTLEILNYNGENDDWLDSAKYIWVNRSITIYYGDASWILDSIVNIGTVFQKIFDGLIEDIDSRNRDVLNLKVRDKMERLNYPVSSSKFPVGYGVWSSTNSNTDATLGYVFGEVHNITPLSVDPSTLEYFVSLVGVKEVLEIRDNGVPVYSTLDTGFVDATIIANGTLNGTTFKLLHPLVGTCTVSVQGVNETIDLSTGALTTTTYANDIASLIAYIVSNTGHTTLRLSSATELDLPTFNTFKTSNPAPVGVYVNDNTSVISICQNLASSLGAQLYFDRLGKLKIVQLGVPFTVTPDSTNINTITDEDIIHHSLSISDRTEVQASVTVGYCKNWTVQSGLETGIPQEHKNMFAKEWLLYNVADSTIKTTYKLSDNPPEKYTMLIASSDATTEATRLLNYYKQPHTVYTFTGTPRMQLLKLGQQVTLTHNRFGLSAGKVGQVVSLAPNWSTGLVTVGVII